MVSWRALHRVRTAVGLSLAVAAAGSISGVPAALAKGEAPPRAALRLSNSATESPFAPLTQAAELSLNNGGSIEHLAMSADGTTLVATGADDEVFTEPAGGWASAAGSGGYAQVGIGGDSLAMSADGSTIVSGSDGSVSVLTRPKSGWPTDGSLVNTSAVIRVPNALGGPGSVVFGGDGVAVSGNGSVIAVGDNHVSGTGVVVFNRPAGGWRGTSARKPTAILSSDGGAVTSGGVDALNYVGVSGDGKTIVTTWGNGYVYTAPAGGWESATGASALPTATLAASDSDQFGDFGSSVAVSSSGSTIAVGDSRFDQSMGSGDIDVFNEPAGGWAGASDPQAQSAELKTSDLADNIGAVVSMSSDGDSIASGSTVGSDHPIGDSAYLWTAPSGGWNSAGGGAVYQAQEFDQPAPAPNDSGSGGPVALGGDGKTLATGISIATNDGTGISDTARVYQPPAPRAGTTTVVSCAPAPAVPGQFTTCTATVTDTSIDPTSPTGKVKITVGGESVVSSPCTLWDFGDTGSCGSYFEPATGSSSASEKVTAKYLGDHDHSASKGTATVTISATG